MGLLTDISKEIKMLIGNLKNTCQHNDVFVPTTSSTAKRLVDRWLKILAGELMLPVANRRSDQINNSVKELWNSADVFHLVQH